MNMRTVQMNSLHIKVCTFYSCAHLFTVVHWAFCVHHVQKCAVACAEKYFCAEMQPNGNWCKIAQNLICKTELDKYKTGEPVGAEFSMLHCSHIRRHKSSQEMWQQIMSRGTFEWKCQNWLLHIKLLLVVKTKAAPAAATTLISHFLQPGMQ